MQWCMDWSRVRLGCRHWQMYSRHTAACTASTAASGRTASMECFGVLRAPCATLIISSFQLPSGGTGAALVRLKLFSWISMIGRAVQPLVPEVCRSQSGAQHTSWQENLAGQMARMLRKWPVTVNQSGGCWSQPDFAPQHSFENFWEAEVLSPQFGPGIGDVKMVLALFDRYYGTTGGALLRQWCQAKGWALVWALARAGRMVRHAAQSRFSRRTSVSSIRSRPARLATTSLLPLVSSSGI